MRLPNGFGSIHLISKKDKKKRRNPYRARVVTGRTEEGKPIYCNVGYFRTQQEAYEALVEYHKNPRMFKEDITIAQIYKELCETAFRNLSAGRLRTFETVFNVHLPELHEMNIKEIKPANIKRTMVNKSPNIQKEILTLVKKMYAWAEENEFVNKNIATSINIASVDSSEVEERESRPFNDKEIRELWKMFREKTKVRNVATALFLLYTGIRVSELPTLVKTGDFYVGGIKTDNGKNRTIPIHPDLVEVLPYVDFKRKGPTIYAFLKKYFGHKTHDTRHTFITYMRKNGANDNILKTIVGHSKDDVTDVYTHIPKEDLAKEMKHLNYPKC